MDDFYTTRNRRTLTQAEGYLELHMPRHALEALARLRHTGVQDPHAFYLRGEALRSLEHYEEAIEPLIRAGEVVPENMHVWLALGWCYKRTGKIFLAIDALERALFAEPDDALVVFNLACYWCLAGAKRQSLTSLSRALELDESYRDLIDAEADFDSLRDDPDFRSLISVVV